jgi:hypothetical protein
MVKLRLNPKLHSIFVRDTVELIFSDDTTHNESGETFGSEDTSELTKILTKIKE